MLLGRKVPVFLERLFGPEAGKLFSIWDPAVFKSNFAEASKERRAGLIQLPAQGGRGDMTLSVPSFFAYISDNHVQRLAKHIEVETEIRMRGLDIPSLVRIREVAIVLPDLHVRVLFEGAFVNTVANYISSQGRTSWTQLRFVTFARSLLIGLARVHRAGYLHGPFAPEDIFFGKSPQICFYSNPDRDTWTEEEDTASLAAVLLRMYWKISSQIGTDRSKETKLAWKVDAMILQALSEPNVTKSLMRIKLELEISGGRTPDRSSSPV